MSDQGLVPLSGCLGARHSTLGGLAPQAGPATDTRLSFHLNVEALTPALHEGASLVCDFESCQSRNKEQFATNVLPLGEDVC